MFIALILFRFGTCISAFENNYKFINHDEKIIWNFAKFTDKFGDKLRWNFRAKSGQVWEIVYDIHGPIIPGYEGNCSKEHNQCNLQILKSAKKTAGSYELVYGAAGKAMKTGCKYELIVGELQCQSSIRQSRTLVGESDCQIKPESFARSCSFSHFGNYNGTLNFLWMSKALSSKSFTRDKLLLGSLTNPDEEMKTFIAKDLMQVYNDLNNAIVECRLDVESHILPCRLPEVSVQYVRNKWEQNQHSTESNLRCSVEKSNNMDCNYYWDVFNENMKFQIEAQNLTDKHLIMPDLHKCSAICNFITGESWQLYGPSFDNHPTGNICLGWITFGALLCFFIVTCLIVLVVYLKCWQKKKPENRQHNDISEKQILKVSNIVLIYKIRVKIA